MVSCKKSLTGGHSSALHYLFNLQHDIRCPEKTSESPIRKKIEVMYTEDCDPEEYIYIETHCQISAKDAEVRKRGISRNLISGELIATERCYDPKLFHRFAEVHSRRRVELCLFDDNQKLDSREGWLKVPKITRVISEKSYRSLSNTYEKLFSNFHNPNKRWDVH